MTDANENSAIVMGLIADGRINPAQVKERGVVPPWTDALKALKKSPLAITDKQERDKILSANLTPSLLAEAHRAAASFNGLGEPGVFHFIENAESSSTYWYSSTTWQRLANASKENDPNMQDLLLKARSEIDGIISKNISGLKPANEIDDENFVPYIKSGIPWVDDILGGWCSAGLIVVVAEEYSGKSLLGYYAACSFALAHPDLPPVAIYTLEMPARDYKKRSRKAYPQFDKLLDEGRILISSSIRDVSELTAEIATRDVSFVVIDHIGKLVKEESTSAYSRVYKELDLSQRIKELPIMVFSQTSRENKKAAGFLDKKSAEWSGEAEQSAFYLLTLNKFDPSNDNSYDDRFPCSEDNPVRVAGSNRPATPRFFVCVWKDRNTLLKVDMGLGQTGVGAIRIEPNKLTGYYDQLWVGEAYGNRLWTPGAHKQRQAPTQQRPVPQGTRRVASAENSVGD